MRLTRLIVSSLRNIDSLEINPDPHLNWIVGQNASGKTSLLEGLYILTRGRSFRTGNVVRAIKHGSNQFQCFGEFSDGGSTSLKMGVAKHKDAGLLLKLNGERCAKLSSYVQNVSSTILEPESVHLLTGASEARRQLIDWTMFHVEPLFVKYSQRYAKALKQRNFLLKQRVKVKDLEAWEQEMVICAHWIDDNRQYAFDRLSAQFIAFMSELFPSWPVQLRWKRGWDDDESLITALNRVRTKDQALGYTSVGAHRADFSLQLMGQPVSEVCSRGQLKVLTLIATLAQVYTQFELTKKKSILLIDDLAAEFDNNNIDKMLSFLLSQGHQLFITSLDTNNQHNRLNATSHKVFHVKHGVICGSVNNSIDFVDKKTSPVTPKKKIKYN